MKYFFATLLSLLVITIFSVESFAKGGEGKGGVLLQPGLFVNQSLFNDGTTKTTNTEIDTNIALGYQFGGGLYLGGTYFMQSVNQAQTPGTSVTQTLTFYGPQVGYYYKGWGIRGGYAFSASMANPSFIANKSFDSGSGYFADVSYSFMITEHFFIAPLIDYYDVTFTKQTISGTQTTLAKNSESSAIAPFIVFGFDF